MSNRTSLEQAVGVLTSALVAIKNRSDCENHDERDRPTPCDCPRCVAEDALETVSRWRYQGARAWRLDLPEFHPREVKMVAAWEKLATDRTLGQILDPRRPRGPSGGNEYVEPPSARDWYVATSVVQWLATNVGRTVLESAGFRYEQDTQDRANIETMRSREQQEENDEARTP